MQAHFRELYGATEQQRDYTWVQLSAAHQEAVCPDQTRLLRDPLEIKDIVTKLPSGNAGGGDGMPSQIIKAFSWQQICFLATTFEDIANNSAYQPHQRPTGWNLSHVSMLPKMPHADRVEDFRPISLIPQVQKVYLKWLYRIIAPRADLYLPAAQHGFRPRRQCSEIHFILNKVRESSLEWRTPYIMMKIDIRKAFDMACRGSVIQALRDIGTHPRPVWCISREMINTAILPSMFGITPEQQIPTTKEVKQGSPESGVLFCITIAMVFWGIVKRWRRKGFGLRPSINADWLQYVAFADDTILIAKTIAEIQEMYGDVVRELGKVGLHVHPGKTQYITNISPSECRQLPGEDKSATGMVVLGRLFGVGELTGLDMKNKENVAWARFNRLKNVLQQNAPLKHRLRILQACILQSSLWCAESWCLTKERPRHLRALHTRMLRQMIAQPGFLQGLEVGERFKEHAHYAKDLLHKKRV